MEYGLAAGSAWRTVYISSSISIPEASAATPSGPLSHTYVALPPSQFDRNPGSQRSLLDASDCDNAAGYRINPVFKFNSLLNSDSTALLTVGKGAKEPKEHHCLQVQCL